MTYPATFSEWQRWLNSVVYPGTFSERVAALYATDDNGGWNWNRALLLRVLMTKAQKNLDHGPTIPGR